MHFFFKKSVSGQDCCVSSWRTYHRSKRVAYVVRCDVEMFDMSARLYSIQTPVLYDNHMDRHVLCKQFQHAQLHYIDIMQLSW